MPTTGKWHPITPLDPSVEESLRDDLAALNALYRSWREFTSSLDEADRNTLRRRNLRKHAIETGILERLYDIDRGVTESLVADGLTREVTARVGGELSPAVVAMLGAQIEGLDLVTEYVRENYPLTTSFVKQLHALITRAQSHYQATDTLGGSVRARLNHGSFKVLPNNVKLADGSLLEFAPPEQVDGEMERLVEWYNGMGDVHPVVSAAWLHHRFVQIHPFQDGNGRVARALTLLSLGRDRYPPLVVDRDSRDRYLQSLDRANEGDLTPLCRLFTKLAMRSTRSELEEPIPDPGPQTAGEVARAFARRLERKRRARAVQRELAAHIRARQLHALIEYWVKEAGDDLTGVFHEQELSVRTETDEATPDDPRTKWWRYQIIQSAKRAEYYADLSSDTWWTRLRVTVNRLRLQFITSMHHVGSSRTGVMAITSFGDVRILSGEESPSHEETFILTSWDAFTFSHDEEVEDRTAELYEWLDQSLAVALQELMRRTLGG